ncbi:MBL fold metallo-hydrolase [Neptuniibacter sp. QD48_55]|uniref:MBL fold metallo-hydrolase n=1 Tax=Neptuniibacter sp. QD48_55 TaxID=3398212 RepID=UPI0039F4DEB0
MAKITHHGAIKGEAGSCHQLFDNEESPILIDCGLFQGGELNSEAEHFLRIEFPIDRIKALVVIHCHIDHVDRLPYLLVAGFDKLIFATATATATKVLPLVIEGALKVGFTWDKRLIEQVLGLLRSLIVPVEYNEWVQIPGFNAEALRFQVAGHILGSAFIEVELSTERVVFSVDIGASHSPLLPPPKSLETLDVLVLESTYGDKLHEARQDRSTRLRGVIENCLSNTCTVLIPAFSIGCTQELLYELESIIHEVGGDWSASAIF